MHSKKTWVYYVATALCCTSTIVLFVGCTAFSGTPAASVALSPQILAVIKEPGVDLQESTAVEASFKLFSKNPYIYRRPLESGAVFFTSIKDCSKKAKPGTKPSFTDVRQLFVGLKDIVFLKREELSLANAPVLKALVRANLEGTPIHIASYAVSDSRCLKDFVFWFAREDNQLFERQQIDSELTNLDRFVERIVLAEELI